jgi:hypothetical protein
MLRGVEVTWHYWRERQECWTRGCASQKAGCVGASLLPRQILDGKIGSSMACRGAYIQCINFEDVGMRVGSADDFLVVW